MVGDVNLFLLSNEECEVEIMVAEEKARRKNIGLEATCMMIR